MARIANLLRLFQTGRAEQEEIIRIGDLVIDPLSRKVIREEELVELTHREYDLLLFLARRQGQVCTREDILKQVWDYDFHTGTNVVDVYILHLREKIDRGASRNCCVRSEGPVISFCPRKKSMQAKDRLP